MLRSFQTEAELAKNNLGKKINSQNSLPIPRPPANASRLDRLLVDFYREHARVRSHAVFVKSGSSARWDLFDSPLF